MKTSHDVALMVTWCALLGGCAAPTPSTSSSSHWVKCEIDDDCATVPKAAACQSGYCVAETGGLVSETLAAQTSCDPAADRYQRVKLGTILGIGTADDGTTYLVDQVPFRPYHDDVLNAASGLSPLVRVFISRNGALKRSSASVFSVDDARQRYEVSFYPLDLEPDGGQTSRMITLEKVDGKTTSMGLSANIGPDPTPLTIRDSSFATSFTLENFPGTQHVRVLARASDGHTLVVTVPFEDYTEYATRAFWGTAPNLQERHVVKATRANDVAEITFEPGADGAELTAHVGYEFQAGSDGPALSGTLSGPSSHEKLDVSVYDADNTDTASLLSGFSFTCF